MLYRCALLQPIGQATTCQCLAGWILLQGISRRPYLLHGERTSTSGWRSLRRSIPQSLMILSSGNCWYSMAILSLFRVCWVNSLQISPSFTLNRRGRTFIKQPTKLSQPLRMRPDIGTPITISFWPQTLISVPAKHQQEKGEQRDLLLPCLPLECLNKGRANPYGQPSALPVEHIVDEQNPRATPVASVESRTVITNSGVAPCNCRRLPRHFPIQRIH